MFSRSQIVIAAAMLAAVTLVMAVPGPAAAGETRDHRGKNAAPEGGVVVGGRPAKVTRAPFLGDHPTLKGGFDSLKGTGDTGATIRDHRGGKPKDPNAAAGKLGILSDPGILGSGQGSSQGPAGTGAPLGGGGVKATSGPVFR